MATKAKKLIIKKQPQEEEHKADDTPKIPPVDAVMAKLAKNTKERNYAESQVVRQKQTINMLMDKQFETFGRLVRYDPSVFDEVLEYAETHSAMIYCDSSFVDEVSKISWYENKKGIRFKAHYTINGRFLRKLTSDDEEPITYQGYFPFTTYKHLFKPNRGNTQYKCLMDFIEKN